MDPTPRQQYSSELLQRLRDLAIQMNSPPPPQLVANAPSPGPSKAQPQPAKAKSQPQPQQQKKVTLAGPSNPNPGPSNSASGASTSKAPVPVEESDSFLRQMEVLKKLLECPVCLQIQSVPMYLCTSGHSVCHACRLKLLQCPLCQHPILNTRNLLVEQIIGTLDSKCPYASEGCEMKVMEADKKKHKTTCYYRPFECNFGGSFHNCKKTMVKYSKYLDHLKNSHNMHGIQGAIMNVSQFVTADAAKLTSDIPWQDWPIQYMEACNQTFITGSTIHGETIFWWLYVFGDRQTADKFSCKIVLHNKAKGLELSWSGPVFSIRCQPNTIKRTGMCLMTNKEVLKTISYPKTITEGKTVTEKISWDLVFHVLRRPGPAPSTSTPSGLNMI